MRTVFGKKYIFRASYSMRCWYIYIYSFWRTFNVHLLVCMCTLSTAANYLNNICLRMRMLQLNEEANLTSVSRLFRTYFSLCRPTCYNQFNVLLTTLLSRFADIKLLTYDATESLIDVLDLQTFYTDCGGVCFRNQLPIKYRYSNTWFGDADMHYCLWRYLN